MVLAEHQLFEMRTSDVLISKMKNVPAMQMSGENLPRRGELKQQVQSLLGKDELGILM